MSTLQDRIKGAAVRVLSSTVQQPQSFGSKHSASSPRAAAPHPPHDVVTRVENVGALPGHQGPTDGPIGQCIHRCLQAGVAQLGGQAEEDQSCQAGGVAEVEEVHAVPGLHPQVVVESEGQRRGGKGKEDAGQGPGEGACAGRGRMKLG